jgi:hypothetical protein
VAVTLMLAAQFVAPAATVCILAGLAVWALSSSKAAIQALCLTVVLSAPNSALGSSAERAFTLKWLVLGAAVVRAAVAPKGSGLNLARVCGPILAFAVCIGLSSLLFGADPGLSLLKLATNKALSNLLTGRVGLSLYIVLSFF